MDLVRDDRHNGDFGGWVCCEPVCRNLGQEKHLTIECRFWADLLVNGSVVAALTCWEALHPVDKAQLLSHLRLMNMPVGLLINFHVGLLKSGMRQMVSNYYEDDSEQTGKTA